MTLIWVLMGLFVVAYALHLLSLRYVTGGRFDETHHIRLPGGRPLALFRIRPRGETRRKHPVICCHGLGACRFNLALPGRHSLAHRLAEEGYDVWVMDLSGFGRSVPANWLAPKRYDVRFEDFVERDGPAAIERVLAETGATQVFWVGHSMGGMTAYGLAQTPAGEKIRGITAIASPIHLGEHRYFRPVTHLDALLKLFPKIDLGLGSRLLSPVLRWVPGHLHRPVLNIRNMDMENTKYVSANVISTTPVPLLLQFSRWIKGGDFDNDRGYSYQRHVDQITRPILCVTCEADLLCPARAVNDGFARIGSADKTLVHFSAATGTTDYGHGDVIFGERAPDEVFPVVIDWINRRDE